MGSDTVQVTMPKRRFSLWLSLEYVHVLLFYVGPSLLRGNDYTLLLKILDSSDKLPVSICKAHGKQEVDMR
jgi:hypothetical protein